MYNYFIKKLFSKITILIICISNVSYAQEPISIDWQKIAEDLELAKYRFKSQSLFSPEILLIRTSLSKYRVATVRAQEYGMRGSSVKNLAKRSKATMELMLIFLMKMENL